MPNPDTPGSGGRKQRLSTLTVRGDLIPWQIAESLSSCFLYWLPVEDFPVPDRARKWILAFLGKWIQSVSKSRAWQVEIFADFKNLTLKDKVVARSQEWMPVTGLSRRPDAPLLKGPDPESLAEEFHRTGKVPDVSADTPDYVHWMVVKDPVGQLEALFGEGGLMLMFVPSGDGSGQQDGPNPDKVRESFGFGPLMRTAVSQASEVPMLRELGLDRLIRQAMTTPSSVSIPPELFAALGMDASTAARAGTPTAVASSMQAPWKKRSKEVFGQGLEQEPQFEGLPFIVPLLRSQDFFERPEEEVRGWLEVFPLYIRESPEDNGILMASSTDLGKELSTTIKEMKAEGVSL